MVHKKILVADDSEDNRRILMYRLQKMDNVTILEAQDGQEALDIAVQERPDLIFMDLKMPRLNGWEAVRRIRAMETPIRHVPIIVLTAHALLGNEEKTLMAGCDAFLAKPIIHPGIVQVTVERLLAENTRKDDQRSSCAHPRGDSLGDSRGGSPHA